MIGLIFWLLTLLACAYAALAGGREGRWVVGLIIGASILTIPASRSGAHFGQLELWVFAVDCALLVGLYAVALTSRRWWPIWMTGFHLIAVLSHLSTTVAHGFVANIYFAAATFWALPMSISMVAGIALDQRADMRRRHADEQPAG